MRSTLVSVVRTVDTLPGTLRQLHALLSATRKMHLPRATYMVLQICILIAAGIHHLDLNPLSLA